MVTKMKIKTREEQLMAAKLKLLTEDLMGYHIKYFDTKVKKIEDLSE